MLNHQKGPKQHVKKNSCSQFQAPVPQTNDQLGANAPTRLLGPPSNWPYDESFALAMHAAKVRSWNDMQWRNDQMCNSLGFETAPLSWSAPFFSASIQMGIKPRLLHSSPLGLRMAHGLGGDVHRRKRWHWSSKKWSGIWAQSMLSFLHFHPGDREEGNVGTMIWYTSSNT